MVIKHQADTPRGEVDLTIEGRGNIEGMIRNGLSEGYRLASESRAVLVSSYQDALILLAVAFLGLWTVLLAVLMPNPGNMFASWQEVVVVATAIVVALAVPCFFLTARVHRTRIREQSRMVDELKRALEGNTDNDAVSEFDLLVEVSELVPRWLTVRRKDVYNRHPFLTTLNMIAGPAALISAVFAVVHLPSSSAVYLAMLVAGSASSLCIGLHAIRTADRKEREAVIETWKDRMDRSRQAMEDMLEVL